MPGFGIADQRLGEGYDQRPALRGGIQAIARLSALRNPGIVYLLDLRQVKAIGIAGQRIAALRGQQMAVGKQQTHVQQVIVGYQIAPQRGHALICAVACAADIIVAQLRVALHLLGDHDQFQKYPIQQPLLRAGGLLSGFAVLPAHQGGSVGVHHSGDQQHNQQRRR